MHISRTLFVALCALALPLSIGAAPAQAQPSGATHSAKPKDGKPQGAKSDGKKAHNASAKVPPVAVERTENGEPVIVHEGEASFYGGEFHGKPTASGERFDQNKPTAASRELPLGTKATVTNQENGKSIEVIVNDRGPYVDGRVIDLSKKAARDLGIIDAGIAPVRVEAKPSDQPSDKAKEKIEGKAEEVDKTQTAEKPPDMQAGGGASDAMLSGSGK